MTSDLVRNLASRGVKGDFKFTDARSLRLFVEGVKGLRAFENSAAESSLSAAEAKFQECVFQYPRDVLPQFYLGIVKVFRRYDGFDDAIRIFGSIARDIPELRAAAMYNLAAAHIELYSTESLDLARDWLEKCIAELGEDKAVEKLTLRFQARVLLLFYEIRQRLWVKRREHPDTLKDERERTVPELEAKLDEFLKQLNAATRIPDAARSDIMADYWNCRGILEEFRAWTASGENHRTELALSSIRYYTESLKWKLNWIPPKSNMARVYMDLLKDFEPANQCWQEVLQLRPGDNYAEYQLGRLHEEKGDATAAEAHYKKAPHIPETKKHLARLYEKLGRADDAVRLWLEILTQHLDDEDALEAQVRLGFPTPTPASGAGPKA